jgi:hypothetical protein
VSAHRIVALASGAAVIVAVAAGLWVVGSPGEQRLRRLDDRRVSDLRQIAYAVLGRWNERQSLPAGTADLADGLYLARLPADPVTEAAYEYRVTSEREFELCAVFDRPARQDEAGDFWYHEAGRHCFAFDATERAPYAPMPR